MREPAAAAKSNGTASVATNSLRGTALDTASLSISSPALTADQTRSKTASGDAGVATDATVGAIIPARCFPRSGAEEKRLDLIRSERRRGFTVFV